MNEPKADVQQRDHPGVRLGHYRTHGVQLDAILRQVVHVQCGAEAGDRQQHQIYRAHPVGLAVTGRCDHQQADQLHHRHPEVAATRVERKRGALESLRKESVDVRHGGGEVAAAEAG